MQQSPIIRNALIFALTVEAKVPAKREGVKIKVVQGVRSGSRRRVRNLLRAVGGKGIDRARWGENV